MIPAALTASAKATASLAEALRAKAEGLRYREHRVSADGSPEGLRYRDTESRQPAALKGCATGTAGKHGRRFEFPIDNNRQSIIRRSAIDNRQSVNRQSPIGSRQLTHCPILSFACLLCLMMWAVAQSPS